MKAAANVARRRAGLTAIAQKGAIAALVVAVLGGCTTRTVEVRGQPACPPSFAQWPAPMQKQMANALRALPVNPDADALRLAIRQSLGVRAELRAAGCIERPAIQLKAQGEKS